MSDKIECKLTIRKADNSNEYSDLEDYFTWTTEYTALDENQKMVIKLTDTNARTFNLSDYDTATNLIFKNLSSTYALHLKVWTNEGGEGVNMSVPAGDYVKFSDLDPAHAVTVASTTGQDVSFVMMVW